MEVPGAVRICKASRVPLTFSYARLPRIRGKKQRRSNFAQRRIFIYFFKLWFPEIYWRPSHFGSIHTVIFSADRREPINNPIVHCHLLLFCSPKTNPYKTKQSIIPNEFAKSVQTSLILFSIPPALQHHILVNKEPSTMTIADTSSNYSFPRNFFSGFRFKAKGSTPKQAYAQPDLPTTTFTPEIPRQAHNPAVHPLLAKPVAREENFVLLPIRNGSIKRKRDPNSPTRVSIKPKAGEPGMSEWNRYLSSYADVLFRVLPFHVLTLFRDGLICRIRRNHLRIDRPAILKRQFLQTITRELMYVPRKEIS